MLFFPLLKRKEEKEDCENLFDRKINRSSSKTENISQVSLDNQIGLIY